MLHARAWLVVIFRMHAAQDSASCPLIRSPFPASSTLQAEGKFFYLDPDHFPDKALLAALTPSEPSAAGGSITR